jgi:protein-disulfide isomerase-like protein with CxxC motif
VEGLADELAERLNFFQINWVLNRQLLIDLNVSGFPTFLFYKQGQLASDLAGRNILLDEIKDNIQELIH